MPNKAVRQKNQNWNKDRKKFNGFVEHDDRSETRRVSFKPNRNKNKNWEASLRSHLEDEDVEMTGPSNGSNFARNINKGPGGRKGAGGRMNSPDPRGKRRLFEGPTNWFKVHLPYGNKYDKDFLFKNFLNLLAPVPFNPVAWRSSGNQVTFYVDDFKVAERIFQADKTIPCPDGYKLLIRVSCGLPQVEINSQMKERMKVTMANRYNMATKALDLTKFYIDPNLCEYFCGLFKPTIMLAAIDIIAQNIPDIEAINLTENRIHISDHMKEMKKKLPKLKILLLGNNKIRHIANLDVLQGMQIEELSLDGNPLCNSFRSKQLYVSEVRKRFPKLLKLDGLVLPPPVNFDVGQVRQLPKKQETFMCSQEANNIVRQFLGLYFNLYDSNRRELLQAYSDNALMSITTAYPYGMTAKNSSWLNWYQTDNRNLIRVQDPERRKRLLKQGQLAIISFLSEMPKTKHDVNSFTVDLSVCTSSFMSVIVTGMFRELDSGQKSPPLRTFSRVFTIIPSGSGYCITNDQLHISNASRNQAKKAFKEPSVASTSTSMGLPAVANSLAPPGILQPLAAATAPPAPISINVYDDNTKQQMIQSLAQQTGMNQDFALKCLNETSWNFERALSVFADLQKKGLIPSIAFSK